MTLPLPVPLLAPERHLQDGLGPYLQAAHDVLASGRYILGEAVSTLEAAVAARLRAPYAVGVSSGTDALLIALMVQGIGAGDHVLCPSYTFFATAGVISRLGAKPIFVDSCPMCMNMTAHNAAAAITPLTRAIMPVHLFGHGAPMAQLLEVAEQHQLAVIEDVAQAMGTRIGGHYAGTMGTLGCLSFFPSKNLGGFGDAGMVLCQSEAMRDALTQLRMHGAGHPRYVHRRVGGNFRLDALQAALLQVRLATFDDHLAKRAAHAKLYHLGLIDAGLAQIRVCACAELGSPKGTPTQGADASGPPIGLPFFRPGDTVNQYVITLSSQQLRDQVAEYLQQRRIATSIYYPLPLHLQPCFAYLGYKNGDLPACERLAEQSLALPIAAELTIAEVERACAAVIEAVHRFSPKR